MLVKILDPEFLPAVALSTVIWVYLIVSMYHRRDILSFELIILFVIFNILILSNYFYNYYPNVKDGAMYHDVAANFAKGLRSDPFTTIIECYKMRAVGWTLPLGITYSIFGVSDPVGRFLTTLFALGVVINLHYITNRLFGICAANIMGILFCLTSFFWLMSCILYRDMMISFFIILFFRKIVDFHFAKNRSLADNAQLLVIILYLAILRPPLIFIFSLSLFFWILMPGKDCRGINKLARYLMLMISLSVGAVIFIAMVKYEMVQETAMASASKFGDINYIDQRTHSTSNHASSSYMGDIRLKSYGDLAAYLPKAIIYFLFSPFPWEVTSSKQALGIIDSAQLLIIYILSAIMLRCFYKKDKKLATPFLIFLIVGIVASSGLQTNAGSAMRHRTMFTYLLYPFAATQLIRRKKVSQLVNYRYAYQKI
jgi:hypothetical protein